MAAAGSENRHFQVGIKGVIIKDGKVLLLRANFKKGRKDIWEVPGGRIQAHESIAETLERELQEEVPSIKNIRVERLLDVYQTDWTFDNGLGLLLVFYKVSADFSGDPAISDEHLAWQWASESEAKAIAYTSCQRAIREAFRTD